MNTDECPVFGIQNQNSFQYKEIIDSYEHLIRHSPKFQCKRL